jgi:UDP-glucose 4-epimerase
MSATLITEQGSGTRAHRSRRAILVSGGAGYIGSHIVLALLDQGYQAVVIDDLSSGSLQQVPAPATFYKGCVSDRTLISQVISDHAIEAVVHCAGSISVPGSVIDPLGYYQNNTLNSHALIAACVAAGVRAFVFSSTAAVYGETQHTVVDEDIPPHPANPYGMSKWMTETMLRDVGAAHPLRHAILRYFNVAGADPLGRAGQSTRGAAHLIKVTAQVATGQRARLTIHGDDYATPDGTCVRDYIHVADLAEAHILALKHLLQGGDSFVANCGYGRGTSVRQIIAAVEAEIGHSLAVSVGPRRPGDVASLVAAPNRIHALLGWTPKHDDLVGIVRSAIAWERKLSGS